MPCLKSALIIILIFHKVFSRHMFHCEKGQRIKDSNIQGCEPCPEGFYQDENNYSKRCKVCLKCDVGNFVKQQCTKVTNTQCQCNDGYVPVDNEQTICRTAPRHEQKDDGGTTSKSSIPVATTLKQSTSISHHHPPEGAQTQMTTQATSKLETWTGNYFGVCLLSFGIITLLILTGVTSKFFVSSDCKKEPASHKNDSLCRQPVEESGDSKVSESTELKPDP